MFALSELYQKILSGTFSGSMLEAGSEKKLSKFDLLEAFDRAKSISQLAFGDRVIVRVNNSIASVATLLAAWELGLVIVPIKFDMEMDSVLTIAEDCNAKAIWDESGWSLLPDYQMEAPLFEYRKSPEVCGSDLSMVIYTSGSTGKPKGIMLTHNNVVTSLKSICNYLKLHSGEKILGVSPLSFDYGLYQVLFCIYSDCQLVLYTGAFNPMKVLSVIKQHKITLAPLVPAMATALVKVAQAIKADISSLKKLTNTGGHLGESTIRAWKSLSSSIDIYSMYGLTECKRALYLDPAFWEIKMGSVGKPIPGLTAKVFVKEDSVYREAEPDEIGELFVRGSSVMQSYYRADAQGGAQIIGGRYREDNWLATGDLFSCDEDGFFYFKGRTKDLIKQAGFCLYPIELEKKVESHPNVHLSAVIGAQDKFGDEIALLVMQLMNDGDAERQAVRSWLRENIDSDYLPREVHFVKEMSLTVNSKVDKLHLKKSLFVQ